MAAVIAYTIGGVAFADPMAYTTGRYALRPGCIGVAVMRHASFHAAGTTGSILVDSGQAGGTIRATARYVNSAGSLMAAVAANAATWKAARVTIVDSQGKTWTRCRYVTHQVLQGPHGLQGGLAWVDVVFEFISDGGES